MTACKKFKRGKEVPIEDLYKNKNFVPPKEQSLETIFEEPKQSKDGAPILTSIRKYKRYLDFDPITGKVQKRNKKGKRGVKKVKGKTRSASKVLKDIDISAVLETLNESSDDCEMDLTFTAMECGHSDHKVKNNVIPVEDKTVSDNCNQVAKNSRNILPIKEKTVNDRDDQMAKLLPIENKTECDDRDIESENNVNVVYIEDKIVNAGVHCKKCDLTEKFCSCESAKLQESMQSKQIENRNETCSPLKPCVVT